MQYDLVQVRIDRGNKCEKRAGVGEEEDDTSLLTFSFKKELGH